MNKVSLKKKKTWNKVTCFMPTHPRSKQKSSQWDRLELECFIICKCTNESQLKFFKHYSFIILGKFDSSETQKLSLEVCLVCIIKHLLTKIIIVFSPFRYSLFPSYIHMNLFVWLHHTLERSFSAYNYVKVCPFSTEGYLVIFFSCAQNTRKSVTLISNKWTKFHSGTKSCF